MNIRRGLWENHHNLCDGWYRLSVLDALSLVRMGVALFIINKAAIEHKGYPGNYDSDSLMQSISSIIVLEPEFIPGSTSTTFETMEIIKIVAHILNNGNDHKKELLLDRITKSSVADTRV